MPDYEKDELTEDELREAAGGKQTRRSEAPPTTEDRKTLPTRDGKLTFRRHEAPER